jgi:hypothetical protein
MSGRAILWRLKAGAFAGGEPLAAQTSETCMERELGIQLCFRVQRGKERRKSVFFSPRRQQNININININTNIIASMPSILYHIQHLSSQYCLLPTWLIILVPQSDKAVPPFCLFAI